MMSPTPSPSLPLLLRFAPATRLSPPRRIRRKPSLAGQTIKTPRPTANPATTLSAAPLAGHLGAPRKRVQPMRRQRRVTRTGSKFSKRTQLILRDACLYYIAPERILAVGQ